MHVVNARAVGALLVAVFVAASMSPAAAAKQSKAGTGAIRAGIAEVDATWHVGASGDSSPYYSSISWGVWAFQDVFDVRFYEYYVDAGDVRDRFGNTNGERSAEVAR